MRHDPVHPDPQRLRAAASRDRLFDLWHLNTPEAPPDPAEDTPLDHIAGQPAAARPHPPQHRHPLRTGAAMRPGEALPPPPQVRPLDPDPEDETEARIFARLAREAIASLRPRAPWRGARALLRR